MIYLEFIERDRWVPTEIFRHLGNQQSSWSEGSVDRMILQLGRTMRLGPRPSYLCFWDIPDIRRLDAWEEYFHSPAAGRNPRSLAMHRSINIDSAGLYDVLEQKDPIEAPLYVVEYCDPAGTGDEALRAEFAERSRRHAETRPLRLLRRLGRLGPDPAVLAVWGVASYVAAEPLLRAPWPVPIRLANVGVYRPFGEEIL
jgi:hypothetical protein